MRRVSLCFVACLISLVCGAQNIPEPMIPARLVNDFAGILVGDGAEALEDSLVNFSKTTSTQIAVVTVKDLDGYAPSDYALAILRKWGVGMKERNNGIVLLLKPRNENGRGEVYISVGGGLEGVLNDAKAGRVIDTYMIEDLRNGNYLQAVIHGTEALRAIVRGEFTADYAYHNQEDDIGPVIGLFIILLLVIIVIVAISKKGGNNNGGSRRIGMPPIFFGGGNSFGGFGGGSRGGFGGFGGGTGFGGGAGRSF